MYRWFRDGGSGEMFGWSGWFRRGFGVVTL